MVPLFKVLSKTHLILVLKRVLEREFAIVLILTLIWREMEWIVCVKRDTKRLVFIANVSGAFFLGDLTF